MLNLTCPVLSNMAMGRGGSDQCKQGEFSLSSLKTRYAQLTSAPNFHPHLLDVKGKKKKNPWYPP